jgi:sodium-dependent dicarboxylate transporter 2/3/5
MLGFMTTTMFLSMWISNTATTAMMVPIVEAVLYELYKVTEK